MSEKLNGKKLYRNSKNCYGDIDAEKGYSKSHIEFCKNHAGNKILDFGCSTGNCCLELKKLGYDCIGVDINEEYVKKAQEKGIEAYAVKERLPFDDKTYDLDVPDALIKDADDFFQKMDTDMDEGWQISQKWVDKPNQTQRLQIVADKILSAFHDENEQLILMMAAYILSRKPDARQINIDTSGNINETEILP